MTKPEARNPLHSRWNGSQGSAQNRPARSYDSSFGLLAPFVIRHSASEFWFKAALGGIGLPIETRIFGREPQPFGGRFCGAQEFWKRGEIGIVPGTEFV
jgi:hypothetical protein